MRDFCSRGKGWARALVCVCAAFAGTVFAGSVAPLFDDLPTRFPSGVAVPSIEKLGGKSVRVAGDRTRFERVWARLDRGEPVRIATVGGSITQGAGATKAANRYADRLAAAWRRAFPKSRIDLVNAGIGATGSDIGAFRLRRDVLAKQPDVVVVEFSVNDGWGDLWGASYEGVLRQLLKAPQGIAVIALGMVGQSGENRQDLHAAVAAHYGVPYVSYRDAVYPLVKEGTIPWRDISPDTVHPNDVGHALAVALLNHWFAAAYTAFKAENRAAATAVPPLPKPKYGTEFDQGEFRTMKELSVTTNAGFFPLRDWCWGEGLACTNAGGRLVFEVEGATVALLYRVGKKPFNWGKFSVRIDGREVATGIDGYRDQWWWLTPSLFLCRGQPGRHVVEVETLADRNEKSEGFGCQLTGVLVSGGGDVPTGLTTEYRENPVGLDTPCPRLSWRLPPGTARQTAYEIEIDGASCGRVASDRSVNIDWPGKPLATSQRVTWRVRTWGDDGRASGWSVPATFVMGVLRPEDWRAKWIGPAAETRPDYDFGAARWITAPADEKGVTTLACSFDFAGVRPGEAVEMVHAGVTRAEIRVNGRLFDKWAGHVNDWRFPRFRDLTPYLTNGSNQIVVRVFPDKPRTAGDPVDPIRVHAPRDVRAFLARITFPDGRAHVTRAADWTSPNGAVTELGGVRDTAFGRQLKLRTETASPAFATTFTVSKPVKRATLHVTGVGFYEAFLNGARIGRKVLDPAPTDYARRVLYSTYELDGKLRKGANELRLLLGHGWYDLRATLVWNFETALWRDFPRGRAQLEIVFADGTTETVVTDGTWRQVESPVAYDDLFEGEVVGVRNPAAKELSRASVRAAEVSGPSGRLVAEAQPGAEVVRNVSVKRVLPFAGGCVLDFGENVVGWVRLTLRGQAKGDVVSIRYDERLAPDGRPAVPSVRDGLHDINFWDKSLSNEVARARRVDEHFRYTASHRVLPSADAAFQTSHFVCSGAATETYEPRFTYAGFRYVVVRGLRRPLEQADVTARFVRTAFPVVGSFDCSDAMFNRLMAAGVKAYESNFTDGVPTDCPHREKNGWTGDASIASELAQYCFENTAGYEKWLRDIFDAQLPNGNIPGIVPTSGWGYHWGNGPAWDSALSVIPWNLWIYRGDRRLLDEAYPHILRYLDYTATKADADGLVTHGLGDWVPVSKMPSVGLTSSCYYYQAQRIAAEIARVKGRADDASRLAAGAAKTAASIHAKYYRGEGVYDDGGQTAQAFPLAFGIVPPALRTVVEQRLVQAVERADGHVNMGLLGTKHVFRALSRAGRTDLAWRMLTNPTAPSPAQWIRQGGTTLWEDWGDGASRNHIMFGDFVGWAYQYLAGIRLAETADSTSAVTLPTVPAFREIVIEPVFLPELTHLSASTATPYGMVAVDWRRAADGTIAVRVTVPSGTTADVRLPGVAPQKVGAGEWTFKVAADSPLAVAVSPDGRNEIRLWDNPLRYDVRRDGVTLVAKTPIGLRVNGRELADDARARAVVARPVSGTLATPVYRKASVDLSANGQSVDFGDWGLALAARNDGVAYRFELKFDGTVRIDNETAGVTLPSGDAACLVNYEQSGNSGCEESVSQGLRANAIESRRLYLPFVCTTGGKTVAVTEAGVRDYPIWDLQRRADTQTYDGRFAPWPTAFANDAGVDRRKGAARQIHWRVTAKADYLVETAGTRALPWRVFALADEPRGLLESDIVMALAPAAADGADFSWVKPGKVIWEWWNDWGNKGQAAGCTTKTYEQFIDFAAQHGLEYVILDEGWSVKGDIWKFNPAVDVPHLIAYGAARNVGLILWMGWAQAEGDEARVAAHFAAMGAKGFKVDFMDRGDAAAERFLWTFADACARHRLVLDYHGAHRPTGMSRAYPNVLNYEGVHGLEMMKIFSGEADILAHDVRICYSRMLAGPLDYTPGAMDNYTFARYPRMDRKTIDWARPETWKGTRFWRHPGSVGTRARQMAMIALYEAPLQMLCDAPAKYVREAECLAFIAAIPTVWDDVKALDGTPESHVALARRTGRDWYVAAIGNGSAQTVRMDTSFLGEGVWKAEVFRDAEDADENPMHYVHETRMFRAGEAWTVRLAAGGGFVARLTRAAPAK